MYVIADVEGYAREESEGFVDDGAEVWHLAEVVEVWCSG
jgi:hypothetical protein